MSVTGYLAPTDDAVLYILIRSFEDISCPECPPDPGEETGLEREKLVGDGETISARRRPKKIHDG